jgi:hypothetical protein
MDLEFPMSAAFDSNETAQMSRALLQALSRLKPEGLMNGDTEALAKAALAKAIVEAAEQGVSSEEELTAFALANYLQSRAGILERDHSNDMRDGSIKR